MVELKYPPPKDFLEPETRDGYFISKEMKEVWAVQLDLLQELLRVCEKYGMKIFFDGGSLLGAIRHKGYIPWDDDIDLSMFREDFEKLCEIAPIEFAEPYEAQFSDSGEKYLYGHGKLRNKRTAAIQKNEMNRNLPYNQGIFIDIFPLDNLADGVWPLRIQKAKVAIFRYASYVCAYFSTRYFKSKSIFGFFIKQPIHFVFRGLLENFQSFFHKKMINCCKSHNSVATERVYSIAFHSRVRPRCRKNLEAIEYQDFEFLKVPIPSGYEDALTSLYGKNWRTPVKAPTFHGDMIFDVNRMSAEVLNDLN